MPLGGVGALEPEPPGEPFEFRRSSEVDSPRCCEKRAERSDALPAQRSDIADARDGRLVKG